MAAEVLPLPSLRPPPGPPTLTPDQSYWRSFKSQLLIPSAQSAPITHISSPLAFTSPIPSLSSSSTIPDTFAITTGSRIALLSTRTRRAVKTITRLSHTDTAYSAVIRSDGRVVLAAGSSGAVQAFDASSRAVLKTWREHGKQPVWSVAWSPVSLTGCVSAGDDRSVRTWDLASEESTGQLWGHTDYVRSCGYVPDSGGKVLVSGSYDGTVRVWDSRAGGPAVMRFDFEGEPVECVLPLADGATVAAGAGERVAVLDLAGRRCRQVLRNHQKTVTCLALADRGRRIVSGGLDGHVKVFDTTVAEWRLVAGFKYPSPVLSVAVVPAGSEKEDRHLAVGMQSGLLSIRTRLTGEQKVLAREKEKEMAALAAGTIEEYDARRRRRKLRQGDKRALRGRDFTGEGADIIIADASGGKSARGKIRNQSKWETALRKGQWGTSLDHVLLPKQVRGAEGQRQVKPDKQALLTLLTALRHRSALRQALEGRDETTLTPLFRFLARYINDPAYVRLVSDVALVALDVYAPSLGQASGGQNDSLYGLVRGLHRNVKTAMVSAKTAASTGGMLDFIAGAELS